MTQEIAIVDAVEVPNTLPQRIQSKKDVKAIAHLASQFMVEQMGMDEKKVMSEIAFANQIITGNNILMDCTSGSVYAAIANISTMGLSLNPSQKQAYLVPRKNKGKWECCLTPSYMGLIKTCTDPGGVLTIEAGLILEGDDYEIQLGSGGFIKHKPLDTIARSKMTQDQLELIVARNKNDGKWSTLIEQVVGVYSKAVLHNGAESINWMPKERLQKVKRLMVKTTSESSPSNLWPDEWMKKTVITHHTKTLPKSDRTALAVELFNRAEGIDYTTGQHTGSFKEILEDGVVKDCPTCEQQLEGGVCHNTQCPDAVPA